MITPSKSLPIDSYLDEIMKAGVDSSVVLVAAEPGSGKTTRLPLALINRFPAKVLVLEPRRLAAKMPAIYVASQHAHPSEVGYQVRYESNCSSDTRLIYMTEGLLLRKLASGDLLDGVSWVVLDEFHERHLATDTCLVMLRELQTFLPIKLMIMSATMDIAALEGFFPASKSFQVPGRSFPTEMVYRPPRVDQRPSIAEICDAVEAMLLDSRCVGDILVFLVGLAEIEQLYQTLQQRNIGSHIKIQKLYADLSVQEQQQAFAQSKFRKIILATNVAETSLTIPGVTGVIDTGLAKLSSYAPWSDMKTLEVRGISQASAIQRAGRAGREQAGLVYRLYREQDFLARDSFTPAEIFRSDLSALYLDILSFRNKRTVIHDDIKWFESPPAANLQTASHVLQALDAIDTTGSITSLGMELVQYPVDVRAAHMIVTARKLGSWPLGVALAALTTEGPILRGELLRFSHHCDLHAQLVVWQMLDSKSMRMDDMPIDKQSFFAVQRLARQLAKSAQFSMADVELDEDALAEIVFLAHCDRIAKKQGEDYQYSRGGGGRLINQSAAKTMPFIVVASATEKLSASSSAKALTIDMASGLSKDQLLRYAKSTLQTRERVVVSDGREERWIDSCIGSLVVDQRRVESSKRVFDFYTEMNQSFPKPFESADDLRVYHRRRMLIDSCGVSHDLPEFKGELFQLLLHAICDQHKTWEDIAKKPLQVYIDEQLSYASSEQLRLLTPLRIKLENGREFTASYHDEGVVKISGFVQDFFGVKRRISICDGRKPVTVELLGPNRRVVQTTSDIPLFWQTTYADVKRELSRRYPRHSWPDDPTTAEPRLHKPRPPR
jgi:ATP-dependent helicase HrpB